MIQTGSPYRKNRVHQRHARRLPHWSRDAPKSTIVPCERQGHREGRNADIVGEQRD